MFNSSVLVKNNPNAASKRGAGLTGSDNTQFNSNPESAV